MNILFDIVTFLQVFPGLTYSTSSKNRTKADALSGSLCRAPFVVLPLSLFLVSHRKVHNHYYFMVVCSRAGIGIPKYRKYREIPKFGIPKYWKFQYRKFQYYWIPKMFSTEFSILLNTQNFNTEFRYYWKFFNIIPENTEILIMNLKKYIKKKFLIFQDIPKFFW